MTSRRSASAVPPSPVHWAAIEEWAAQPAAVQSATQSLGERLAESSEAPSPAQGAALRLFAATITAEQVLVLGSTGGVSEAWLAAGMAPEGTLTVIDPDPHRQALTRDALAELGSGSVRVITAQAAQVLPRLTDTGYDLIVIDEATAVSDDAQDIPRLLRPGGLLIIRLTEHEGSRSVRDVAASLREDPRWTTAWLTVGAGLIVAVWHATSDEA